MVNTPQNEQNSYVQAIESLHPEAQTETDADRGPQSNVAVAAIEPEKIRAVAFSVRINDEADAELY
jgi:hypothetical protein